MDDLARVVATGATTSVTGRWQRHVDVDHAATALEGRRGYGRWGTASGFPVLYLGQPLESVIVEAYRHLVGPVEDPGEAAALAAQVRPRTLITAEVNATEILDLRHTATRVQVGLTLEVLRSGTDDRESYAACQEVAQVAHQLGRRGIVAPSATEIGETLALFPDLLPAAERPARVLGDQLWAHLPADPRIVGRPRLRIVTDRPGRS
jgi:hypothetical protein